MNRIKGKIKRRARRKNHIKKTIRGDAKTPRMTVYRSNKQIYIQVVDDNKGETIVSASTVEKDHKELKKNVKDAEKLGKIIGDRLKEKKIKSIVFDRNGYLYHGIVKSIADGSRKAGIKF